MGIPAIDVEADRAWGHGSQTAASWANTTRLGPNASRVVIQDGANGKGGAWPRSAAVAANAPALKATRCREG